MTQFCAPAVTSPLNPNEFRFFLHRAPYLSFFVQKVQLPTISLPLVKFEDPFTSIPVPGDHITWDPLIVEFLVDENLQGYQEMFTWIQGMGFPDSFDEYKQARYSDINYTSDWTAFTSDISVFTNTGHRNVNIEYHFNDAWPTSVTAPRLDATNPTQPVVTSTVSFNYSSFNVVPKKTG